MKGKGIRIALVIAAALVLSMSFTSCLSILLMSMLGGNSKTEPHLTELEMNFRQNYTGEVEVALTEENLLADEQDPNRIVAPDVAYLQDTIRKLQKDYYTIVGYSQLINKVTWMEQEAINLAKKSHFPVVLYCSELARTTYETNSSSYGSGHSSYYSSTSSSYSSSSASSSSVSQEVKYYNYYVYYMAPLTKAQVETQRKLGLAVRDLTFAEQVDAGVKNGVYCMWTYNNTPADSTRLSGGGIVTHINGIELSTKEHYDTFVQALAQGTRVQITAVPVSGGTPYTVTLTAQ